MENNHTTDLNQLRDRLVLAALPHVAFDAWTEKALNAGAADLGLDATMPARLFESGPVGAVAHLVRLSDRLMLEDAAQADFTAFGDRARLAAIIKLRFDRWLLYREAIRRAVGVLALPRNLAIATQLTWGTADAIWKASGKSSHDVSWYTRRASLAAVYAASVLVWLDDQSDNGAETQAFLMRRLDQVTGLVKLRRQAWDWLTHRVPGLSQPG